MATLYSSGASTPDATESTAGKLRISTALEATTGTNDTTAMTPAKVAAAISAGSGGITGALVYRGSYDASTASPDLTTASKGDFYLVSVAGALDGVALSVGDHVVFNQDAANPVTAAVFDKIDSTDAVSSVNGQTGVITLTASDVNALASGDNVSELTNDSGYLTSAPVTSVNTQTGVITLTASDVNALASGDNVSALTNDSGYLTSAPVTSVNTQTGVVNLTAANVGALASGDNVSSLTNDSGYLTSAPVTSVNTQTGVITLTASDVGALASGDNVSSLTNDSGYLTSTLSADIIVDTDGAYDLGTESARLGLTFSDLDGAVTFKASNASGAQIAKGQPVYIAGVSGDVPTVALADADAAAMPCAGLAAETANSGAAIRIVSFGNLAGVDTSSFSLGDTLYIDTTAGQLVATPPAGETAKLQNIGKVIRVHATSGIIKVGGAGRSAATPNLDQNKIFLGDANNRSVSTALSAVALSSFNNDLGLATVATTGAYADVSGTPTLGTAAAQDVGTTANDVVQLDASARLPAVDGSQLTNLPSGATQLNDLSDVSITGAATGEVLRYSGSSWVDATLAYTDISGTPTLAAVATSGAYADLSGTPTTATETTEGTVELATNAEAQAATATDKALVPSNIGSIDTGDLNDDGTFLKDLSEDTTPQLGGNLDVNGNLINSVSNGDIEVAPNGTGSFKVQGNATSGSGRIVLNCEQNSHGITLKGPPHSAAADYTLTFPTTDGSADQVLKTDGSGVLDWVDQSGGGGGGGFSYNAVTTATTAQAQNHYAVTGTTTITLPAASGVTSGQEIRIKNIGTDTVTITRSSTDTIDAQTSITMAVQYQALSFVSNGSDGWEII